MKVKTNWDKIENKNKTVQIGKEQLNNKYIQQALES